jgi:hypothetical protein
MEPIELLRHFFVTGMSRSRRVHYQLSIIHYQLSIIHYQLSIIHYPLSIIHYPLSIIHYPLSIIHYPLSIDPPLFPLQNVKEQGAGLSRHSCFSDGGPAPASYTLSCSDSNASRTIQMFSTPTRFFRSGVKSDTCVKPPECNGEKCKY